MIVQVTQQDIDYGRSTSASCPIALAIRRCIGTPVCVSMYEIVTPYVTYTPPKSVRDFIVRFDGRQIVYPFEFDLVMPDRHPLQYFTNMYG